MRDFNDGWYMSSVSLESLSIMVPAMIFATRVNVRIAYASFIKNGPVSFLAIAAGSTDVLPYYANLVPLRV